ncbi:MAG TPA: methionine--tRNA ligase subunit beta [Euryarchaeota archaeon]|nr:methionine--tRNA ligase subunit beta [Euryarchaeota archaeon]
MATYEDFAALDIRVALVKEVERIPKSKKLYRLKVDLGGEERTVVAGLAERYGERELLGKKVVVLANLEPRTIMGVRSEGMLLAVEDGAVLTPERDVRAGARVR